MSAYLSSPDDDDDAMRRQNTWNSGTIMQSKWHSKILSGGKTCWQSSEIEANKIMNRIINALSFFISLLFSATSADIAHELIVRPLKFYCVWIVSKKTWSQQKWKQTIDEHLNIPLGWLMCICICILIPILVRASHFRYEQASLEILWEIICSHSCLDIHLYYTLLFTTVKHLCFCW